MSGVSRIVSNDRKTQKSFRFVARKWSGDAVVAAVAANVSHKNDYKLKH